jgi:acetoin utilization protein AcuB
MDVDTKGYMTGAPISIEPGMPALAALDLMVDHAIRHLPVVDSNDRVCGIVSFDDLRAALPIAVSLTVPPSAEGRQQALDVSVSEVMTPSPVTIGVDTPLDQAVSRMIEGRFSCLPVVDENGHLDGILTVTDLLHTLATVLWSTDDRAAATDDSEGPAS